MASVILVNVKEEVTCPICLEFLEEPRSLDCGHTFCQTCITTDYESTKGQKRESSCPVCRVTYRLENLRPNKSVASIVERLKDVKMSPEEGQEVNQCARHGEKLLLFCKEDSNVICWLCERSQEHRGHHTFLMEEVAQEHRVKLQTILLQLMKKEEESEEWKADIQKERIFLKNQIQDEIQNVKAQFEKWRDILDMEEKNELQKLEKEEEGHLRSLAASENELVQQSQLVRALISSLQQRLEGSTMQMLQDVNDIMERCRVLKLQKPNILRRKHITVCRAPDLNRMWLTDSELTDIQRYWVHVKLTSNMNPAFVISPNQRQIRYDFSRLLMIGNCAEGVLGSPGFSSGKHYWEVDVSKKSAWILGLNTGTCLRHPSTFDLRDNTRYQPKYGYWVIRQTFKHEYNAFEDSSGLDPQIVTLSLPVAPQCIGVFLDFEARTLSFYNVKNPTFRIYKFSTCSFLHKVFPYLNPLGCPEPMILCDEPSWPRA